ncbi:MAG: hypothetical protein ACI8QC_002857 [Planctomycetota bacterium]|jgi:hypothetical protein
MDALPGLEVLDRSLELDGLRTDLVGVDAEGRLNLVLFVDGAAEGLPLEVLDTLRLARRQRFLLQRHLNVDHLKVEAEARVTVVAASFESLVGERLACLPQSQVQCFEVHEMRSDRGLSTCLLPAFAEPQGSAAAAVPADEFVRCLNATQREAVSALSGRIERIDGDVAIAPGPGGLEWRYRGSALCRLRGEGDGLMGSVVEGASFAIEESQEAEAFLDGCMRRFLLLLEAADASEIAAD